MFIKHILNIIILIRAVFTGVFAYAVSTRLKFTIFFLILLFFFNFFFLIKSRDAVIKFFKAPATKLEVYILFAAIFVCYGIYIVIANGVNFVPLFNIIFFSTEGAVACIFIFVNCFLTLISNHYNKNSFSSWLFFKDCFTIVYYLVVIYILIHWAYNSLFLVTFVFFEIIITFFVINDIKYAPLIRIPLLGFYSGLLAHPLEICAAFSNPELSGYFATLIYISWLYDFTGVATNFWVELHHYLSDLNEFIFSGKIFDLFVENFGNVFWIFCGIATIGAFVLTYIFEKQWQFMVSFLNINFLQTASFFIPVGFFLYFVKFWTYFHMFVFVIFCSEVVIYLSRKLGGNMDYAWMLRFPIGGFLLGVASMPIENVSLDLATQPRGYFATWLFIYFIWDSILFDLSFDGIVDFHDFLVTISDPALLVFSIIFSNNAFTNVLYAVIYAVTILTIIIVIAFFTVFERKVLAAIQRRRGPNIVGVWGLLQAIADGLKLLSKEPLFVSGVNYYIFLLAPIFLFTVSLTAWAFIPIPGYEFNITSSYTFLLVFLITGLNSFAIILAGVSSNSRYSLIGGIRAIAQLISYEIPLSISILILFIIQGSFDLHQFIATKIILTALALPALLIFFICLLAETNRTPFDLPEAEAELVAGYNLEYSSILFSLFFLAEYNNIMIAASLLSIMFFGEHFFYVGVMFFCLVIIFVRSILPRYTFAQLINMCWTVLFPLSVLLLILLVVFMYIFDISSLSFVRPDVVETIDDILKEPKNLIVFVFASFGHVFQIIGGGGTPKTNVFIFFIVAFLIVSLLVAANWVLVNFKSNNRKNSPYECGFEPVGSPISDFTPNFLAVALIFLIYDVEILLTFPWAYSFAKSAAAVFCFVFFLVIMLLGLIYEVLDDSFHVY